MSTAIMIADLAVQLKAEQAKALSEQSTIDKSINDFYHMLEYLPLNACQLSKVAKQLKLALQARRALKEMINVNQVVLQGSVEKLKTREEIMQRTADRDATYRAEAKAAFNKFF